jgi:hypothetical protein
MSLNTIFATLLLLFIITIALSRIPHLVFEVMFYTKNKWNLSLESGRDVWKQKDFLKKFSFLPVGDIKFLVLVNQVLIGVVVIAFWVNSGLNKLGQFH